jgi:hypothetical protein
VGEKCDRHGDVHLIRDVVDQRTFPLMANCIVMPVIALFEFYWLYFCVKHWQARGTYRLGGSRSYVESVLYHATMLLFFLFVANCRALGMPATSWLDPISTSST